MTSSINEIRGKIKSNDEATLRHSLLLVSKCLEGEIERGKAAETRATAILAGLVIFAGFTVPLVDTVKSANSVNFPFFCLTSIAFLLFLVKGIYYSIKTLGVVLRPRLEPDIIYEFHSSTFEDCLRNHISEIIWVYKKSIQPNTNKLFWLDRSQRNCIIAISLYVVFVAEFFFLPEKFLTILPSYTIYILSAVVLFVFIFGDKLLERSFWHKS